MNFATILLLLGLLSFTVAFWPGYRRLRPQIEVSSNLLEGFRLYSTPDGSAPSTPASGLKAQLNQDMKAAMKNKEKTRLAAIRAVQTLIKQKEVDDRQEQTDEMIIALMSKLVKQRKESIKSYQDGGRLDLVATEQEECDWISSYMPKQMSEDEISSKLDEMIAKVDAKTVKEMGKVMNEARPFFSGKADMALVGDLLKKKLGGK